MKLRRRIGSVFLAFAMALSLIPSVAVSALAATGSDTAAGKYVTLDYGTGNANLKITVNVLYNGEQKDTFTVSNGARSGNNMAIRLNADKQGEFEIENVSIDPRNSVIPTSSATEWSFTAWNGTGNPDITITVTLCDKHVPMEMPEGEITYEEGSGLYNRTYRLYDEQILKILYFNNVFVSKDTEIKGVEPVWVNSFGTPDTGSDKNFTEVNREHDYWNLEVVSDSADLSEVQPGNIRKLIITYNNGGEDQTEEVYAKDLRCIKGSEAGYDHHYVIQLNHNDFHIVYFYNEKDGASSNNYTLYDVKFVDHGNSLGDNMPNDPTYNEVTTRYEFVAWTETYDGGRPFLSTTVVNEDTVVYAQKALSTITSYSPWIHVMNNDNLLKERIAELYGVDVNDIGWDELRIAVYGETDDIHTNPEYGNQGGLHNKWDDKYEHFNILNYSSGAEGTDWENDPIHANDITKIGVYVVKTDGTQLAGPKFIEKGLYDGEFAVSTGKGGSDALIELYINSDEYPDDPNEPDPGPTEPDLSVTKSVEIPGDKETASVGDTLEYTITVKNEGTAEATDVKVWDSLWTDPNGAVLVNGTESYVSVASGFCTVDVPTNGETTIYYTYTVPKEKAGQALTNSVWIGNDNVPGDDDPRDTVTVTVDALTPDQVTITYHGNGGSFTNQWGTHTETNETGTYGSKITLYNTTYYFQREGYTNLGWSTTKNGSVEFQGAEKVTLNEDTFDGLSESKHIDLYAVWEKNAPTFDELNALGLKVTIDCVSNVGHADGQVPLIKSTPGSETCVVEKADGETDTYEIWVKDPDDYIAKYNGMEAANGYTHKYHGFNGAHYFTVQWDSTAGKWTVTQDKVTILAKCMPEAPTDDQLKTLLDDAVKVQCVEESTHNCTFDVKDGYTVSGPTADGKGGWTYTVTVNAEPYVTDFNTKNVGEHWLVDDEADTKDIVLTWDADHNTWTRQEQVEFDVTCKPDAPTTEDLNKLFPNGVEVDCITTSSQSGHPNKDFSPVADDTYTTIVEQKDGKWTCKVTVTGASYVEQYVADIGWPHTANDATRSVTLVWEDGKWAKQDNNNVMVVFDVECQAPGAPTYDQLKGLFKVQIDCITSDQWGEYKHQNKDYAPIEGSYTLGNVTANADGTWDLVVTVKADKYVEQYSEDRNETHTLVDAHPSKTVTLVYKNGAWTKPGDDIAFTFDVKCAPKYDLVYHGCGGTTENDKETVSSTFPYFGEATIKNNPFLRDGYVFEGWALKAGGDVVYTGGEDVTFNDVNFPGLSTAKKAELYAVWALDKQGAIDPDTGEETGDGIADYRQVFVRYKSADAALGSVTPTYQVETLDLDENGDPIVVNISLYSVATANEGAEFIYWMQGLENTVSYEASLKDAGLTLKNYTPGYTYEFTAYFMDSDIGKPEPVQTYEIDVDVINGTGTFFGTEVTTHILAMEGEDITIAFAPDAGYALDTVTVDGEPAVLTADGTYTFTGVAANHSITVVYATDAWNDKDDTTTGGDGIPDKYQVVVEYVAGKGGKITGKQVEVLTIYDADGHYSIVGDVTATGSQAAAFHNWDFSRWVAPNGGVASWHPTLDQQTIENAEGGNTYVFTAHFRYDPYIPPVVDPDPDDPTPPPVDPDDKPELNTEDHYAYIVGYEDGTVRPEGEITRAEVATIFFRLLTDESRNEYWSQTNDYTDVAEGDWYNNAVSTLSNAGILNGYEDGTFQPDGNITRAEAMTMVNRTIDRHPDAEHFLDGMITWSDNHEDAWYYEQVQEATNSHEYTMNTDDEQNPYEIWTELLPVRDWAQLEKEWSDAHSGQSGGDVV